MRQKSEQGVLVDPVSMAVLAALAGGAGGEIGRNAWSWLAGLVRRPANVDASGGPDASDDVVADPGTVSAVAELVALETCPQDLERADEFARALRVRAEADVAFARALAGWAGALQGALAADPQADAEVRDAALAFAGGETVSYRGDHIDFGNSTFSNIGQIVGKIDTQNYQMPPPHNPPSSPQ